MKFGDTRWYAREWELSLKEFQSNMKFLLLIQVGISALFFALYFFLFKKLSLSVQLKFLVSSLFIVLICQVILFNNLLRRLRSMKSYRKKVSFFPWLLWAYLPFAGLIVWAHAGFEKLARLRLSTMLFISLMFSILGAVWQIALVEKFSPYAFYTPSFFRSLTPAAFQFVSVYSNRNHIDAIADECSSLEGVSSRVSCFTHRVDSLSSFTFSSESSSVLSYAIVANLLFSTPDVDRFFLKGSFKELLSLLDRTLEKRVFVDRFYLFFPSLFLGLTEQVVISILDSTYYGSMAPKLTAEIDKILAEMEKYEDVTLVRKKYDELKKNVLEFSKI